MNVAHHIHMCLRADEITQSQCLNLHWSLQHAQFSEEWVEQLIAIGECLESLGIGNGFGEHIAINILTVQSEQLLGAAASELSDQVISEVGGGDSIALSVI